MSIKSHTTAESDAAEWLTESEVRRRLWIGRVPRIIFADSPPMLTASGELLKPAFWLDEYVHTKFLHPQGKKPNRMFRKREVEDLLWEFAWHEAGHAVIGEECGFKSLGVSILPYDLVGPRAPAETSGDLEGVVEPEVAERLGIWILAGRLSQEKGTGRLPRDDWERGTDRAVLEKAAHAHPDFQQDRAQYLRLLKLRTQDAIAHNWSAIEEMAQRLYADGEVGGDDVREIIRTTRNKAQPNKTT